MVWKDLKQKQIVNVVIANENKIDMKADKTK